MFVTKCILKLVFIHVLLKTVGLVLFKHAIDFVDKFSFIGNCFVDGLVLLYFL